MDDEEAPELVHRWVEDDELDDVEGRGSRGLEHASDLLGKLPDGNNTPFSSLENGIRDGGLRESNQNLPPEVDCRVGVDCLSGTSIGHPPKIPR
jgi:hypothetical protein